MAPDANSASMTSAVSVSSPERDVKFVETAKVGDPDACELHVFLALTRLASSPEQVLAASSKVVLRGHPGTIDPEGSHARSR